MRYDVFFYEAFQEEQEKIKTYLPENIKAGFTWKTIQEYGEQNLNADLISVRTQSDLPVDWAKKIRGILSRSTGYDHLVKYRSKIENEIALGYLPLYCNRAVAEQAIMLAMALYRKLPVQLQKFNNFNRDGLTGKELHEKTLVVYGVGNIGSEVVKIGKGLGMEVYGVDIEKKHDFVDYVAPEFGFEEGDIIVCAMNLTEQNENYFNYKKLQLCLQKPILVNVARGELSYATDLLKALQKGLLSGLALDVYNQEGKLADVLRAGKDIENEEINAIQELKQRPDVILTPHNSFNTEEAVIRKSEQSVRQVRHFLENDEFDWEVPQE